jgi:cardiolipin synthase
LVDLGGRGRRRSGRAPRQPRGVGRLRRLVAEERRVARYAWPAGVGAAGLAWYAADSLRHRREGGRGYRLHGAEELDPAGDGFLRAAEALTSAPISWGSEVELLINGDRIFPCLLETIRSAEKTICMTTYAWWRGDIAHEVADALVEQARAGVECNVIIDAVGAMLLERAVLRRMHEAGVRVVRFRPPKPYAIKRLENRTHRKLLIVDGCIGMTGGVGIAEEWTGDAQDPDHWRDTHVRVRGPVVRGLFGAFADNWLEATGEVLIGDGYLPELPEKPDGGPMMVVRSSAGVGDTNAEALYYLAIAAARRSLDLTAAYFEPRPAFIEALCEAARRGVGVRVLVPGRHIDKNVVRVAGRAAYDELIACGVELHEYAPTMLHAKTMVVDGVWSSVGSVNFDNRSFQLHDEATLCVRSEAFAAKLTEQFERDLGDAERIDPERWARRGPQRRATEAALRLARREL